MRFERLTRGQVLAAVAALALLLVMAMDWYGTRLGDEARRVERTANPAGPQGGEIGRTLQQDARAVAMREEKNAWQADALVDRVLLAFLLLSVATALGAAVLRSEGRRYEPPWTPSALAAVCAVIAAMLVAYRIIQEPGLDSLTTVKAGPLLALIALAGVGIGSAHAFQKEVEWADMRRAAAGPI